MTEVNWVGPVESKIDVGDVFFLIEKTDNNHQGATHLDLRSTPAYTNQSRQPKLYGWCGETNNISVSGRGLVKVTRIARNWRVLVQEMEGDELAAGLEDMGYPELIPTADA